MNEMFDKIATWEANEIKAASVMSDASAASVNRVHAIRQKWNEMRRNVMKVVFNAEQYNRQADWKRKYNATQEQAAAMFPASR